jgi:hypothetical protein
MPGTFRPIYKDLSRISDQVRSAGQFRRPGKVIIKFIDKISQKEFKTFYSGLRISGMALSNQSDFPALFSPWKVILKFGLIPGDDLPRMDKSRKMFGIVRTVKIPFRGLKNAGKTI